MTGGALGKSGMFLLCIIIPILQLRTSRLKEAKPLKSTSQKLVLKDDFQKMIKNRNPHTDIKWTCDDLFDATIK